MELAKAVMGDFVAGSLVDLAIPQLQQAYEDSARAKDFLTNVRRLALVALRPDDALGAAQALLDALEPYRRHHTAPLGAEVHTAIANLEELLAENHRNEGDA